MGCPAVLFGHVAADYQARHLADQQARADAHMLQIIAALASLLGQPGPHPRRDH